MAELATFIDARREPTGPVETFSTEVAAETVDPRRSRPRTRPRSCSASRTALAAPSRVSQISAGRKNSLQYEIDGSSASVAWDSEQPDQLWLGHRERPNEILIRNPALMGPAGRAAAALPGGHVEGFGDTFAALFRAVYADVAAGARPTDRPTPPSPTATTRCSSTTRSPRAPGSAAGSTSSASRSSTRRPAWRRDRHEARPADRAVPGDAARRGRGLDGRQRLREHRDRLLAAGRPARPGATPARRTSTSPT